jgi:1-acyl-sn-glycerol-3-phosphate acyltransferase
LLAIGIARTVLNFIFRTVRAIPIASKHKDPQVYERAFEEIDRALARGELVCIFPEGTLTEDGDLSEFKTGFEKIIARRPVPVIPMALRGLWGSFFSAEGGFFKNPKRFWSRVDVVAAAPVAAVAVNATALQQQILTMRGDRR